MKKIIMMLVLSLLAINLVGCSPPQQAYTENSSKIKVAPKFDIVEQCYDGVIYIRAGHGLSVKFNQDSSVATCYIVGN